jgi:hypothetical protein
MDMFQEQIISQNVLYDRGHGNYSEEDRDQNWNNKSSTMPHTHTQGKTWEVTGEKSIGKRTYMESLGP